MSALPQLSASRDLRIDFMRGMAVVSLICVHIEIFSFFNLLVWERLGLVTGAEGFVLFSGFVIGATSRKRLEHGRVRDLAIKLWGRAWLLYRVSVVLAVVTALLAQLPGLETKMLTEYCDRASGASYPTFPFGGGVAKWVNAILLLKTGPHATQVLGFYVFMLLLAPAVFAALRRGAVRAVLLASWLMYLTSHLYPVNVTGAFFESAFPVQIWQLLFVHGLCAGYFRSEAGQVLERHRWWAGPVAFAVAGAFFVFAQTNPNPVVPAWARLALVDPVTFRWVYTHLFDKVHLGIGRLLNDASLIVVMAWFLGRFWAPVNRLCGWFLVPLGQASLYVFILHLAVVFVAGNLRPFGFIDGSPNMMLDTLVHGVALFALYLMVRYDTFGRWVPR
jgi:hypothetical protein